MCRVLSPPDSLPTCKRADVDVGWNSLTPSSKQGPFYFIFGLAFPGYIFQVLLPALSVRAVVITPFFLSPALRLTRRDSWCLPVI